MEKILIDHNNHPIELTSSGKSDNYILITPDQINFNNFITNLLDSRIRGGIVVADSGIGKTTAIRSYSRMVNSSGNNELGIVISSMSAGGKRTPGLFFSSLLIELGVNFKGKHGISGELLKDQYITYLADAASRNNGNLLVIFDEAQHIKEEEYYYFMDVVNKLSAPEYYINVKTVLVGTKELLTKKLIFIKSGKNQIVNRFMSRELELLGINSAKKLNLLLQAYDTEEYKGETFTQHYFPEAYIKGCRMASVSDKIWDTCKESAELKSEPRITMEDACTLVEYIFKHYGHYTNIPDNISSWLSDDIIKSSISNTGLIEKLKYYEEQESIRNGII